MKFGEFLDDIQDLGMTHEEYVRLKEQYQPEAMTPQFLIKKGHDGFFYAVFANCVELDEFDSRFPHYFYNCRVCCFGNHDNAFCLGSLH